MTVSDLRLQYKQETGIYPMVNHRGEIEDLDYVKWLEDKAIEEPDIIRLKKHTLQSVFDEQIRILDEKHITPWKSGEVASGPRL